MQRLTCKTALLAAMLATAGLVAGCFDSHCPDGAAECASGGGRDGGGGGGGGDDRSFHDLCLETCGKFGECLGTLSGDCEDSCSDTSAVMECSNEDELFDALDGCNEGPCGPMGSTYSMCLSSIPPCE